MEYIYAAMLIHKAGGKPDEATVTKVLEAAGVKVDGSRVKALVASLEGVNIDEAVEKAATVAAPAPAAAPAGDAAPAGGEEKKEDKPKVEENPKADENAAAGLGALFG